MSMIKDTHYAFNQFNQLLAAENTPSCSVSLIRLPLLVFSLEDQAIKWFKHISDSLDDPFVFELIDRFGGDGYLVFFGVLEILSREFKPNSDENLTYSYRFLSKKLQLSRQKFVKILNFCKKRGRFSIEFKDDEVFINCPKLADLCDEYTRKSFPKSQDSVRTVSGKCPPRIRSKKKKEKKNIKKDCSHIFEELWSEYPNKTEKSKALERFEKNVDPEKDFEDLKKALINYKMHLKKHEWKSPQNGATWFGKWKDWVDFEEVNVHGINRLSAKEDERIGREYEKAADKFAAEEEKRRKIARDKVQSGQAEDFDDSSQDKSS